MLALVLAAVVALIGWRVLAPADVLDPATAPYPVAAVRDPGVTGRTNMAPLIVDDRIRVYAGRRQVRADGPVDAKGVNTAYWSLRRWPARLTGVAAAGTTVLSHWSDGELIAMDGVTGRIVWRAGTDVTVPGFEGHRTGAATVWAPPALHVAAGTVVVAAGGRLIAYEAATGRRRWALDTPADCTDGFTTAGGQYACRTGAWTVATGQPVTDWPAGPYTPLDCGVAASGCAGLRDGTGHGWLTGGARPARAATLDTPGTTLVAGTVQPADGSPLRFGDRSFPGARVLGTSRGRAVLLTAERHLLVVDPGDGRRLADFPMAVGTEKLTFEPGRWQLTDGHAAIERLAADGPADPDAPGHYFTVDTVIIAAL